MIEHLCDVEDDGAVTDHRFRRAGDFALTGKRSEAAPQARRRRLFRCPPDSPAGVLYGIYDADMNVVSEITIEQQRHRNEPGRLQRNPSPHPGGSSIRISSTEPGRS
jgi:hypothetical protein